MCCCLLLLTGANFFVYKNSDSKAKAENYKSPDKETPSGEESSKAGTNLTIQEEYVHEVHLQHLVVLQDKRMQYNLFSEEEYTMIHYELISPPPDFS